MYNLKDRIGQIDQDMAISGDNIFQYSSYFWNGSPAKFHNKI